MDAQMTSNDKVYHIISKVSICVGKRQSPLSVALDTLQCSPYVQHVSSFNKSLFMLIRLDTTGHIPSLLFAKPPKKLFLRCGSYTRTCKVAPEKENTQTINKRMVRFREESNPLLGCLDKSGR